MVKLTGKSRALYCAVLSALLIAALFCGCATMEDTDNVTDKKTVLPENQPGADEEPPAPGVSVPVYTVYKEAGYAFNNRFLEAFPWDKYGDYTPAIFRGDTNILLVSNETELRELFGETYSIAYSYEENGFAKNNYFQDAISKYNEEFFENHQLLTFYLVAGGGGDRHELESVVYTDGVLTVTFNYLLAGGTAAIEHWFAIVEIDSIPAEARIDIIVERNMGYVDPNSNIYKYPHHYMFTLASVTKEEDQTPGNWEGLSAKTEKQIIQDYWDILVKKGQGVSIENIRISRYYGTYNGYAVVIFDWAMITVVWGKEIGGIYFQEGTPPNTRLAQKGMIAAWKDGVFYDIAELYTGGQLTREDLIQIADRQAELRGWKPPAL